MPRVIRIINRLNLGGPTYNAAYLTRHLAPEFETLLVAGVHSEGEESSEHVVKSIGVEPFIISEMSRELSMMNDVASFRKIKKVIKDFKPDIVHTHAAKAGALGRIAAIQCKVPVLVHTYHGHYFHSYFHPVKTKVFLEIERWLARKTDAIVAISETQKHELGTVHKVCPPEKIHVIPLGFDLTRFTVNMDAKRKQFREKYGVKNDETAIGIIGRLVPVKNHSMFLKAIQKVFAVTKLPVKAFIIGDGEDRKKIELEASSLALAYSTPEKKNESAQLIFTSWIKDIDVAVAGLDIIALTSFNEGTPVSLIEAQAAGKPVVSTKVGGVEEVIIENETGLLCKSDDAETFASQLLKLTDDSEMRMRFSLNAGKHVMQRYHVNRLVDDMRQLYRKLLSH
ncbi:MAG: glycosyltransferase [Bacteroidia bacterium]|nr:glycosyltransferase [Bacteroidia bacterium]